MDTKQIEGIKSLIQLDVDAVGAYEAAIERVPVAFVRDKLAEFRVDHVRHIQDLTAIVVAAGAELVEQKPDIKGAILKGFTAVTSTMGTEAALLAMMGNEELTTRTYQSALKKHWEPAEREIIEKNYADEQRHLAWIKKVASERPWTKPESTAGSANSSKVLEKIQGEGFQNIRFQILCYCCLLFSNVSGAGAVIRKTLYAYHEGGERCL